MAYIDENGYAWTDDDSGSYVFTKDRVKIDLESGWDGEYEYKYLPDSNELIFYGTVHNVEIKNNNEIIIRNSCCGSQLQRTEQNKLNLRISKTLLQLEQLLVEPTDDAPSNEYVEIEPESKVSKNKQNIELYQEYISKADKNLTDKDGFPSIF